MPMAAADTRINLQQGRRRRILQENLTAYAFLLPAGIIIFIFGLFPVIFAFFVSLHRWRRFPDQYIGLGNYEQALGGGAYVLFFWAAIAALALGVFLLWRFIRKAISPKQFNTFAFLLPGAVNAGA